MKKSLKDGIGEIAYRSVHLVSSHGYEPSRAVRLSERRGMDRCVPVPVCLLTVQKTATWQQAERWSEGSCKGHAAHSTNWSTPGLARLVHLPTGKQWGVQGQERPQLAASVTNGQRPMGGEVQRQVARARNQKSTNRAHSWGVLCLVLGAGP